MNVSFVISLIRCCNRFHSVYISLALSETSVSKLFKFLSYFFVVVYVQIPRQVALSLLHSME